MAGPTVHASITPQGREKLARISKLKTAFTDAIRHGAIVYANGFGGKPIVDGHFTKSNTSRFPPLSPAYAKAKQAAVGDKAILVYSGDLRSTVNSKGHTVDVRGGIATIHFKNLKDYAIYLHEGTAKMPIRSPVQPNDKDIEEVKGHMRAYLARATGVGLKK